jgi:hypothetical protein
MPVYAYTVPVMPQVYPYMYAPPPAVAYAPPVAAPPAVWNQARSAVVYRNGLAYALAIP